MFSAWYIRMYTVWILLCHFFLSVCMSYAMFSCSIISFQDAFVDYVIPKAYFNDTDKSYYASINTCVQLDRNSNPGI